LITHRKPINKLQWLRRFCTGVPWLDADAIDLSKLPWRSAEELGHAIRLTAAERERLHVKTIAPCDLTYAEREVMAKRRRVQRERERRRRLRDDRRGMTRAQYEATSLSRTMPWATLGISRSTWERRRRRGLLSTDSQAGRQAGASGDASTVSGKHKSIGHATCVTSNGGSWRPDLAVLMHSATLH
jgi:hypothetical protein